MPYARRPVCGKNQEQFRVKQPFCWSCKQNPIPSYFFCQTCMPNSNFFPVRHPTENLFLVAKHARQNSRFFSVRHPHEANVCEGGNVSTVARNMCFPRVARFCAGHFSCGLRRVAGEMSFFSVHASCGNKILRCDDVRSVCRTTHRVCVKRSLLPSSPFAATSCAVCSLAGLQKNPGNGSA